MPAKRDDTSRESTPESSMTCGGATLARRMRSASAKSALASPRPRISPLAMTTMRSAKSLTTSMSWQTMMTAQPFSAILPTVCMTVMHSR